MIDRWTEHFSDQRTKQTDTSKGSVDRQSSSRWNKRTEDEDTQFAAGDGTTGPDGHAG